MKQYKGYVFDLDGTIYLGDHAIPGAPETLAELRRRGARVAFLSNKPIEPAASYAAKLNRLGIQAAVEEVLNSSIIMARYLSRHAPGARVYLIGEEPLAEELRKRGIKLVADPLACEYVVVSWDRQFTYKKLNDALQAIRNGARFIATHPDRTCPVPGGEVADVGGMIGAVEGVTGKKVELITGKPSPITVQEAMDLLGLTPDECIMVGDRLETDMRMGREAGMATALVLTGVTRREQVEHSPWKPDYVLESVAGLVAE
ncbi:phosphoglycolate/pyridoxal phosphate phosphatase family enzyme [Symbiobacterium terraclitae]|uniref:Acid sugar phosphatase n=1 Tax=Symbiobacterium terraclitae TaxID=557451 RepID=A0ABS4JQL2_9FIRM|nr:HAD-IIA family hydrolase [Symbiobacterium terraclitae]MBP2017825.1 phosphoglycolate/pyridoxal phosphate phosphatase family enzyme [Symbiobacterium terraclitae]